MVDGYRPTLISYIDLLGFKDLIDEKGEDAEAIRSVLKIAKDELSARLPSEEKVKKSARESFYATNFSDLIVRCTTPIRAASPEELVIGEVAYLSEKQLSLILQYVLVRGGICFGAVVAGPDYLFGEGLIKSYILEKDYAIFPRIVIDRDLIDLPGEEYFGICSEDPAIERGQDGVYYINYLYAAVTERLASGLEDDALAVLDQHRRAVEYMLNERIHIGGKKGKRKPTERMKQKYMWLGLYHNRVVQRLLTDGKIQAADATEISPELLRF